MQEAGKHLDPERVLASPYLSANQAPWNEGRPSHNSRVHRANWSIGVDGSVDTNEGKLYENTFSVITIGFHIVLL